MSTGPNKIPPSLLLLSRVFYLPEEINFADKMKAILAELPDNIAEEVRLKLSDEERGNLQTRLELIKTIENQLEEDRERKLAAEKAAAKKAQEEAAEPPKDSDGIPRI